MNVKVLIVDDDPELLHLIGLALKRAGYQTITALNAAEAMEKVSNEQPDLVILDVMLPGVSGVEFCRQLRSQATTVSLPIIMLSARTQVNEKIEGLEAGADEYLAKPINPKEMVARVASLLSRTERLRNAGLPSRGVIISVLGAKGGVGVTTVTLNLAIALAHKRVEVIAVELRPHFGTFAVQLGQKPVETIADMVTNGSTRIDERTVKTHLIADASGINILYGPLNYDRRLELDPVQTEAMIMTAARMADVVLLDLPNHFSAAVETALRSSDQVLLVTRPEADSLAAGRRALDLIRNWGIGRGVVDAVVVNHVPLAMGINLESVENHLRCRIISVIPPASDASALVQKRGRPLMITQPSSIAVSKFYQLADCIIEEELEPIEA